ncbi:peptide chain release factor N(5)-glutamine methyltransferase [Novosphingobium umbonatum]|uniref:Release factor glutamine methyltransferase n=1 Tax=Novosphingobium umbonatum TaxID=1908524 RepID=A0A437N0J3_9SPHN|nr:peptide chain release factor N(5)-glutamine methyltransferase [Novosphingobium umbonatum]RVU03424.1 peptide chain release factor N(5)-glutamine methyltransferase [Novosphingobium umbonatum]
MSKVAQALVAATQRLAPTSDTARLDAEVLMAHALGCSRSSLLLSRMGDAVPEGFAAMVERRAAQEPVAYVTGVQEFWGLPFKVTPDTLIPRGDSETIVEAALDACPAPARVLDCGTGTGALLLAVLHERPQAQGIGIERSAGALAVARENAAALGLDGRATMQAGDWTQAGWADGLGRFDLILSNPPYVEEDADLSPSVRDYEPASALFAGRQGLDDYACLLPQLLDLLTPAGVAVVEIGHQQAGPVAQIAGQAGMDAQLFRDLAGRARALLLSRRQFPQFP